MHLFVEGDNTVSIWREKGEIMDFKNGEKNWKKKTGIPEYTSDTKNEIGNRKGKHSLYNIIHGSG